MAKRFGRYKFALSLIRPQTGNVTIPTNTPLHTYTEWVAGNRRRTEQQAVNQPRRLQSERVAINAFGYIPTQKMLVKITGRAHDKVTGTGNNLGGQAIYNWVAEQDGAISTGSFDPAKAIVFLQAAQTETLKESFYTGVKYNPMEGESYTVPFGEATAAKGEIGVQDEIIEALNATDNIKHVYTFKPEKLSRKT